MTKAVSSSFVLFVDHQGHVAPIGCCYHATASRRLSSSIERHPPSTQTEIDSAFCPQCLSFHDVASASQLGYCPKTACQQCPQCQSFLTVMVLDQRCFYACGYCDWDSKTIGLSTTCMDSSQGEAAAAAVELGSELLKRRSTEMQLKQFQSTLKIFEAEALEKNRRRKLPNQLLIDPEGKRPWSMEALNTSLKNKSLDKPLSKGIGEILHDAPRSHAVTVTSLLLSPQSLPLPIPLRPRKSRRCRAELVEGRPGILVKPKLNPLEGDTSLRSSHGQWFKKDSSAILVLPRVRVERQQENVLLLSVHNPTLGEVRLSFGPSTYPGEPLFDDPTQRTPHLKRVLVDSLRNTTLDHVVLNPSFRAPVLDVITLEAVEDTFHELSGNVIQAPELVRGWTSDKLGWIAQQGDTAWLALDLGKDDCVPLAMNIVVANDSWESSLIKSDQKDDFVTFDMVLIQNQTPVVAAKD